MIVELTEKEFEQVKKILESREEDKALKGWDYFEKNLPNIMDAVNAEFGNIVIDARISAADYDEATNTFEADGKLVMSSENYIDNFCEMFNPKPEKPTIKAFNRLNKCLSAVKPVGKKTGAFKVIADRKSSMCGDDYGYPSIRLFYTGNI